MESSYTVKIENKKGTNDDVPKKVKNRRFQNIFDHFNSSRLVLVVVSVVCIGVLTGIGLPSAMQKLRWVNLKPIQQECQLPTNYRLECLPGRTNTTYTHDKCTDLKCCWDNSTSFEISWCFHAFPSPFHYVVSEYSKPRCDASPFRDSVTNQNSGNITERFVSVEELGLVVNPDISDQVPVNGPKSFPVMLKVHYVNNQRFTVKILDSSSAFEPDMFLKYAGPDFSDYGSESSKYVRGGKTNYRPQSQNVSKCLNEVNRIYDVQTAKKTERFFLNVKRRDETEQSIFNTDFGAFIFAGQFFEFTAVLPSSNIYGLGSGNRSSLRHSLEESETWSLFNRSPYEINSTYSNNSSKGWYGSHPFYLCIEKDGRAHGVLLAHTNIMEVTLKSVPSLTIRSTGRWITMHFFMGPTPAEVIRQLTTVIGKPVFPAYWSLGHHVCRSFTAEHEEEFLEVSSSIDGLREARVPQESDCVFLNDKGAPWTLNTSAWDVTIATLKNHKIKLTHVHSPLVPLEKYNSTSEAFIKREGDLYEGKRSGKPVVYINVFQNPAAKDWIIHELKGEYLASQSVFEGFILTENIPLNEEHNCKTNIVNIPPFVPGSSNGNSSIDISTSLMNHTICMDVCHGPICSEVPLEPNQKLLKSLYHYNLHNLYGHGHTEVVFQALQTLAPAKRPFIVTLSSFTGTGRYGGHWNGEIIASWHALKASLIEMLEFNLYGIPLTGSPACGFTGEVTRDLCSRWAQLSAFQPLAITFRKIDNSSDVHKGSSHPFLQDDLVTSVAAAALQLRYSLLPYFYSVFRQSSLTGEPVVRPLFYEWPKDKNTYSIDEQFLWGPSLMVSPVVHPTTTSLKPYFPAGTWYDFYDGKSTYHGEKGGHLEISAIEYHINLHVRGGHILATQKAKMNTEDSRKEPLKIQVAIEQTGDKKDSDVVAEGHIYIDDGDGPTNNFLLVDIKATRLNLTFTPAKTEFKFTPNENVSHVLKTIFILGLKRPFKNCQLTVGSSEKNSTAKDVKCTYDSLQGILSFRNLQLDLRFESVLEWNND